MNTYQKNQLIMLKLDKIGIDLNINQINVLRRAALTLRRWHELECGTEYGNIEQDEKTGKWKLHRYNQYTNKDMSWPIPDREKGALKRIEAVCKDAGIYFYIQGDPRGCPLYVSKDALNHSNYNRGFCEFGA